MIEVLTILALGIVVGVLLRKRKKLLKINDKLTTWAIWLLLFLLGLSVGLNDVIMDNLKTLGLQALALTFGAVSGSVLLAWLLWITLFKKQGDEV